jgi:ribosomal-protein-serine acetyltransferase
MPAAVLSETVVALRAPAVDDAPDLFARVDESRAALRQWLPWVDQTLSVDDSRVFLQEIAGGERNGARCATWLIEADGELAGCIDIHAISQLNRSAYIGYWLADRFVGRGLMRQAVRQALDIGFGELGLNRLGIAAAMANTRSRAVAERLGSTREGVLREYLCLRGQYLDACQYSMLAREWRARS